MHWCFYGNKSAIRYLWRYYKGDQPVLYRTKISNEDITNKILENHAYEIVQFKVGQTYGEPVQFISRKDDDAINNAVDELNDFMTDANKQEKTLSPVNGSPLQAPLSKLSSLREGKFRSESQHLVR